MNVGTKAIAMTSALLFTIIVPARGVAKKPEIRVQLLNALTGKPYVGRDVQIFGDNSPSGILRAKDTLFHLQTTTGSDGIAHFRIPGALPYRILVEALQNGGCAWHGAPPIIAAKVLKSGYVGPNECASKRQSFHWKDVKPEPGEIILFVVEPRGP